MSSNKVIIIGAGFSGLVLANRLAPYVPTVVYEKSRAVGGRLATRYTEDFTFDHGAQFFTAKDPRLQVMVQQMLAHKVIDIWQGDFAEITNGVITKKRIWDQQYPHYVGIPKMNEIGKWLSRSIQVHRQTQIDKISLVGNVWHCYANGELIDKATWMVLAIPIEQALPLLPIESISQFKLADVKMQSCYSLMLGSQAKLTLPWDAALVKAMDISWISANHSKPARDKTTTSIVALATNLWADVNINTALDVVQQHLFAEVQQILPVANQFTYQAVHRWKYANKPSRTYQSHFLDTDRKLGLCGDWCIKGVVEGAFLSATKLADELLPSLSS